MTKISNENNMIDIILHEAVHFYHQKYGDQLAQVWLYGSKARGDYSESSDMDIMVVVDEDAHIEKGFEANLDKHDMVMSILARYDELISVMTYAASDFNSDAISLHKNIKEEGILYYDKYQ